jgi:hypothetical protein
MKRATTLHKPTPSAFSDPAWERAKAARRNIDHNGAVQESFFLQKQFRKLWNSKMARSPVDVNEIIRTLTRKRIAFVLTGAHAIGGWTGRPRDTYDVDILVKGGRNYTRAVNAIGLLYPQLEVRPFTGVTGFFIPGEKQSVIDVMYPHRADMAETLAHPVWTDDKELGLRYRIPSLEAALANKYGAMVTPSRDLRKRLADVLDFTWMVVHSMDEGRQAIDLQKLADLGGKVCPEGGAEEICALVNQARAGIPINLDPAGRLKRT